MVSPSKQRKRGVILTPEGYRRLQEARRQIERQENLGGRYSLENLSERTGLAPRTVTRVLACAEGVDKQTLEQLFWGFSLELTRRDYTSVGARPAVPEPAVPSRSLLCRIRA